MNRPKIVKPIPTVYGGYEFRSRLEARWAYFFDIYKIPYIYEPEGLDLDGIRYLPDFYLPDCKQFFEVKGIMNDRDFNKINRLIEAGYSVTVGFNRGIFRACDNDNQDDADLCYQGCHRCSSFDVDSVFYLSLHS